MRINLLFGLAFILFMETVPAVGHHYSFAAEYNGKKPVESTGTVTRVEWINPHARFYLDVALHSNPRLWVLKPQYRTQIEDSRKGAALKSETEQRR
jgi:hypothetical protein